MVTFLIVTALVYVVGNAGGYVVHRLLHQPWTGRPYEDHYNHHFIIYPPEDYLSYVYREPPIEAEQAKYYVPVFVVIMAPLLLFGWEWYAVGFVESCAVLKLNAWIHDSIHVRGHWLERFDWFHTLRDWHLTHHVDVSKNFGIFSFFTDHILGTFKKR